jgi:hypothetical protein
MKMYSMYDAKAKIYSKPFVCRNRGEALRSWETAANDNQTDMSKFPADFCLFEIADFNDDTCKIEPYAAFESLGFAIEFVKIQPSVNYPTPIN